MSPPVEKKLKILAVDDNREFCQNLKDIVELLGHTVVTAYGGAQALELAQRENPDLVLLDMVMPEVDGLAVLVKFKELGFRSPTVLVTAFGEEEIVATALKEGAVSCINKPVDFDQLIAVIEKAQAD